MAQPITPGITSVHTYSGMKYRDGNITSTVQDTSTFNKEEEDLIAPQNLLMKMTSSSTFEEGAMPLQHPEKAYCNRRLFPNENNPLF